MTRFATVRIGAEWHVAAFQKGGWVDVTAAARKVGGAPTDMLGWIGFGRGATKRLKALMAATERKILDVTDDMFAAPLANAPHNMLCVGANYQSHIDELLALMPNFPVSKEITYFTKDWRAVVGPTDPIALDAELTQKLDWEAELGVVIGSRAYQVTPGAAMEHVFGYTVINDVSARDLILARGQWFKGKSVYRTSPIGPVIVTADEIADPHALRMRCSVNGKIFQDSLTQMIHPIPKLIADLSASMPLEPGDVIATGTPAGVGIFHQGGVFLKHGDVLETDIEGIGVLRNKVVRPNEAIGHFNSAI